MKNGKSVVLFLFCLLLTMFWSCKDEDNSGAHDPSQPVVLSSFEPSEGSVRSKFFINGGNFGNDPSKIKIFIGGVETKVVGADNKQIYCQIPKVPQDGTTQIVDIKVELLDDEGKTIASETFEEQFKYHPKMVVGTLTGKIDPANPAANIVDGSFEEAEFMAPYSMVFNKGEDGMSRLYLVEVSKALREINLTDKFVSTLVTNGQAGMNKMQTLFLDITRDTIFLADDHGQNDKSRAILTYATKEDGFRRVYPYMYDRTGYSCTQHPDGTLFYNTFFNAGVSKARGQFNETTQKWESKQLFDLATLNGHTYVFMHPDGLYAYIMGAKYGAIYRANYNSEKKELEPPQVFVGDFKKLGYIDAPGTKARFGDPLRQGVFVKNKKYVEAGREDVYDFYVCDATNNCIRKITPDTEVTTVAGRGTQTGTTAANASGYVDGDPRLEARFKTPTAIAYDEEEEVLYVGDEGNRRIRYIRTE